MSRYRVEIRGEFDIDALPIERGGPQSLFSGAGIQALLSKGMKLEALLLHDRLRDQLAEDFEYGIINVGITEIETGQAAYYDSGGKWKAAASREPIPAGHIRLSTLSIQRSGDEELTQVVGHLSVDDSRKYLTKGMCMPLALPEEDAA